jgi:hypothetical protein
LKDKIKKYKSFDKRTNEMNQTKKDQTKMDIITIKKTINLIWRVKLKTIKKTLIKELSEKIKN